MIPKIIFKYSEIYDRNWQSWFKIYDKPTKNLSSEEVEGYIDTIAEHWGKYETSVLQELSGITGLEWKEKEIVCYVVSDCRPFSDPLTLPVYRNADYFIDILVHELIHRIFSQEGNYEKAKDSWEYIYEKYKDESHLTKIHIPLDAVHMSVHKKVFGIERSNDDINKTISIIDYKRAWGIVDEEGYEKIVEEFRSRIKNSN